MTNARLLTLCRRIATMAAFALVIMAGTGSDAAQQPPVATLQGTLQIGEFFGPPNYGEQPRTDRREEWYYIQLPAPIGVQNPTLKLGAEFERATELFVQVRLASVSTKQARSLLGRKVVLKGSLDPALTARERTGVVINASSIAAIQDWRW